VPGAVSRGARGERAASVVDVENATFWTTTLIIDAVSFRNRYRIPYEYDGTTAQLAPARPSPAAHRHRGHRTGSGVGGGGDSLH